MVPPELLVVVEILVSQRQRVDSLPDHLFYAALNPFLVPAIDETPAEPRQQVHLRVGFPQQQASPSEPIVPPLNSATIWPFLGCWQTRTDLGYTLS